MKLKIFLMICFFSFVKNMYSANFTQQELTLFDLEIINKKYNPSQDLIEQTELLEEFGRKYFSTKDNIIEKLVSKISDIDLINKFLYGSAETRLDLMANRKNEAYKERLWRSFLAKNFDKKYGEKIKAHQSARKASSLDSDVSSALAGTSVNSSSIGGIRGIGRITPSSAVKPLTVTTNSSTVTTPLASGFSLKESADLGDLTEDEMLALAMVLSLEEQEVSRAGISAATLPAVPALRVNKPVETPVAVAAASSVSVASGSSSAVGQQNQWSDDERMIQDYMEASGYTDELLNQFAKLNYSEEQLEKKINKISDIDGLLNSEENIYLYEANQQAGRDDENYKLLRKCFLVKEFNNKYKKEIKERFDAIIAAHKQRYEESKKK